MAKTLIAFFSRADENYFAGAMRYVQVGNTEIVCDGMKELIDTDVFKIEMQEPYSPVYMTCIDEAKKDLRANARPALVSLPDSIEAYDTIILAYPNYWGTVLPLCTNEGSGMGHSERDIQKACPGAAVRRGLSVTGSNAANAKPAVRKWLAENGLL